MALLAKYPLRTKNLYELNQTFPAHLRREFFIEIRFGPTRRASAGLPLGHEALQGLAAVVQVVRILPVVKRDVAERS